MSRLEDPLPERQPYLDNFKDETFISDINERRGSTDSRASSNVFFFNILQEYSAFKSKVFL
jgi:hypothetical protein